MDDKDEYLLEHYRSMTQQALADRLGINKSTVSRRLAALRKSGELDAAEAKARKADAQTRTETPAYISRAERLELLGALKQRLERELELAGGGNLARVASEYRRTIEELESLSVEMQIASANAYEVGLSEAAKMKRRVIGRLNGAANDRTACDTVDVVLEDLAERGAIRYSKLDAMLSTADITNGAGWSNADG